MPDLIWLVASRNEIQSLLLELYNQRPEVDPRNGGFNEQRLKQWNLLVGVAFSLWRAVFLVVDADDEGRDPTKVGTNAQTFLLKVIKANSITFGDDVSTHGWSSGYYLNNARYRIKSLLAEFGVEDVTRPGISNAPLRDVWTETFRLARVVLARFEAQQNVPADGPASRPAAEPAVKGTDLF